MKTLRHTLTTLSLALTTLLTPALTTGCQDDPLYEGGPEFGQGTTKAGLEMTEGREGALQQEGNYWVATKRVPLVGVGRVADDIGQSLVSLLQFAGDYGLDCLFDNNLTDNYARIKSGGVNASVLAGAAISIKDMYHTYRGGQTVGFVIKNGGSGGVLSVDVIKTFFIETYLNNVRQESIGADQQSPDVLKLDLLTPANSEVQTISATASLPFDEIRLCFGGISADVFSTDIDIYYGFVGENEAKPITKADFPNAEIDYGGMWGPFIFKPVNLDHLLDADDEGPIFAVVDAAPSLEIDLKDGSLPAGSEVGYKTITGGVLGVELFKEVKLNYTGKNGTNEVTLEGSVAGVSLLSGGQSLLGAIADESKGDITKLGITFSSLGLNLTSGTTISYAYYRDPIEIDPSYYFGIGNDTITAGNSYKLPKPAEGSVQYQFISGPAMAAVSDNVLHGMSVDGDYRVQALYTAPAAPGTKANGSGQTEEEGKQIVYDFTITRRTKEVPVCHTPITVSNYPKATLTTATEDTGCLLCLGADTEGVNDQHTGSNVVDANTNNYAGTVQSIAVADNQAVVAIDAGQDIPINGKIRVGFVLQTAKEFLNLNALQFFRIKVRNGNNEVLVGGGDGSGVAGQNEGIGLGLLAGAGDKIRYSVELDPAKIDTDKSFRYIELYDAGLVDVSLSALRVYYAFWEDTGNEACADIISSGIPGDACIEMLSAQRNNAQIDYQLSTAPSTAQLLTPFLFNQLENAVDNDRNTAAIVPVGVQIGGATKLGIKFDRLTEKQAVGVILQKETGVADIGALEKNTEIKVFDGKTEITSTGGDFTTAGIKLIGSGDRYALEVTPQADFDRIQIIFNQGLASALENYEVYGVYYRPDSDGNGIPDCSENPDEEMPDDGISLDLATQDICVGDPLTVNAEMGTGTPIQDIFYLQCLPTAASNENAEEVIIPVRIVNGKLVAAENDKLMLNQHGVYAINIYAQDPTTNEGAAHLNPIVRTLTVHPDETTWLGKSSDWNSWDNWSDGVPWDCTNVIIPGNTGNGTRSGEVTPANYPVLDADGDYHANNIYFGSGAQLVNSFYLNYYRAWVDIALEDGRYYLLAAPLKDTYSGDWFIPEGGNNEALGNYPNLNEITYPEQRLTPRIYQRLWSKAAPVVESSSSTVGANGQTVSPDETRWTPPYNGVAQAYGLGQHFSLMAKGNGDDYTFRFPKKHTTYHYYGLNGQATGQTESIARTVTGQGGRFIYEEGNGWEDGNITVTLPAPQEGNVYLGGNPFLAHVDITQLMSRNDISEIKVYDGNEHNTLILVDGELISSNGNTLTTLKPLEAFFAVYEDGTSGEKKDLTFADGMFSQGTAAFTRSSAPAHPTAAQRLTAARDGHAAHALLRIAGDASEAVVPGEDTRLLIEGEARPRVAIYTVADGQALDIQQRPDGPANIPLGFYLPDGGKADIRLTLDFTDSRWTDWFLVDLRTGQRRRLTPTTLTLQGVENGSGQYALTTDN